MIGGFISEKTLRTATAVCLGCGPYSFWGCWSRGCLSESDIHYFFPIDEPSAMPRAKRMIAPMMM